ncbi:MAG: hypothetical protein CL489_09020 [Acidobacteria bacterium]|nr:hypothetical protein [Acidobacteriota bacterium]|tara:strand:- start:27962 stop:28387 length:426 start_codon:yes stop_codon:yes gene_type:complete
MLDDLMDEKVEKPKPKKKTKTKSKKKDEPKTKATKKPRKSTKSKTPKPKKRSTRKPKKSTLPDKEPAEIVGDSSGIPNLIHDYLLKKYYVVDYNQLGKPKTELTREFRIRDTEDKEEDYIMFLNIIRGGRNVELLEFYSNV